MKKIVLLSSLTVLLFSYSRAQEICNDGIDNDGDGFIDCFDGDCSDDNACDGFYLGNDASCEAEPSDFPQFSLELGNQSLNNVTNNLSRIAIGDLDRDGIPEILTQNKNRNRVFLLNGTDASVKHEVTLNSPEWRASMANVQDDNCGEVFVVDHSGGDRIKAYDCELNFLWETENLPDDPMFISFADFDHDGLPEMYYKDEIRDAITGTRLVKNAGIDWDDIPAGPVAVDILGDDALELVIGNKIYSVNLSNRSQDGGSLTLEETMPGTYQTKNGGYNSAQSAATSVADYNLDGNLDVIVTGADGGNVSTAFLWDVENDDVKTFSDPFGGGDYQFGWKRGMGRVNIADLDGVNGLNAAFVSGRFLYALDENWDLLWRVNVNEETSGTTGCTLFDFNGDGQSEVVYRDEDYLYIINGKDGTVNTEKHCRSRTSVEYPIVADVDADGSTEICIVCVSEDYNPYEDPEDNVGANLSLETPAEVRIYKSAGEPWVPARRVWNQHGYFNVNINDDLTVPRYQQDHQAIFSSDVCSTGPVRPLNSFLNQSPFLSSDGCPTFASPDLNFVESTFTVMPPNCPDEDFTVSFDFENIGDLPLSGFVPITFYDGDPLVAGTNKLNTDSISLNNFEVNEVGSVVDMVVNGTGAQFTLYAVLNDNGSTTPTPISFPSSNFLECDYFNNIISADVNPIPFALSTEVTSNVTCSNTTVDPTGSARVFRLVGGAEVTADYDFFWFNGTTVDDTPDYTGSIYTGLSAGTYTVFATDKLVGCSSDTVQVVVSDSARIITADITVDRGNDNCSSPNGQLSVVVNGGEPVNNFTYEWYEGNTLGGGLQISNSHIASGLEGDISYVVLVTEKSSGCTVIESLEVPDNTVTPNLTASATDIVCSDSNSGSVTASVDGSTANYTFEWFIGGSEKPTPDYTGNTVSNLPQGNYTVIATDNTSDCASAPVTVNVNQTVSPEIATISSTENNSCDSNLPNGTVSVSIVGDPSDHTIEWFAGASTTTAVIGTGLSLSDLGAGEYTVLVTNDNTGCIVTDRVVIINNIIQPSLSATTSPVTRCSPFDGRIEATVDLDNISDYTFSWYEGNQVKSTTDFSEAGNILDNLEPGFYTVQAFHNTRNCLADAITVEVIDEAIIAITQTDAVISLPTSCSTSDGVLQVEANSPNNTSGFLLEWFDGSSISGSPFLSETGVNVSQATNLVSGLYTVLATDLDNGCSNQQIFNLPFADAHQLVTTSVTNATTCNPNNDGTIDVELTPTQLSGFDESNYTIYLYTGNDITGTPIDTLAGTIGQDIYNFSGLGNGTYTIEALADASLNNCSVYSFAEIELEAVDPVVNTETKQPNTNCDTAFANGSIEVSIDNSTSPTLYTINWYEGNDTSTPLGTTIGSTSGVNGEQAVGLIGGDYTVEVFNNATQCSTLRTLSINDNPVVVSVSSSDLQVSNITRCDINNSEAIVTAVYEDGVQANFSDFTFRWYDSNMNLLPSSSAPNTSNSINGLAEGDYFVMTENTNTGCETSLIEFTIESELVEPTISVDFRHPERCSPAFSIDSGELRVTATAPGRTFSFEWYNGTDTTAAVAHVGADYLNLTEGFYTVAIRDSISNCVFVETYELVAIINPVNISASATPLTNCVVPDGSVFATITSGGNYNYSWTDANGNVVGTTKEVMGLPEGEYSVVATSASDSFCEASATVTISNEQVFPALAVDLVAPLTVCDLELANGAAMARVDSSFIGYTFEWFEGNTATGNPVYVGPNFSEMEDNVYTVRVTDNLTQCTSEESITIPAEIPNVESPTVEILSNDTNCQIDNGALRVDVGGNTGNYTFDWFRGENANGTAFASGDRVSDLGAGTYTVIATDLRTGCQSEPVTAEIVEVLVLPELDTESVGTFCSETNGSATVFVEGNVDTRRIEWYNSFGTRIAVGPNLSDASAGSYTVSVETVNGCFVEEEVVISSDIQAYNGISRNGDVSNSYFKIDCIAQYPNNLVKIYNRAGTLVYEAQGYDNNNTKFDGIANKGINILGDNLPSGTYFYVIDKNDGSKPENGYLEIVN